MEDTCNEIAEEYGVLSPEYLTARFLQLRHYRADNIADFQEHKAEIENSPPFTPCDLFCSANPFDFGSYSPIVLVTLREPCLYEETSGANTDLNVSGMRRVVRESLFWLYCSGEEDPCLDMTPNAEISDRTGMLKVISGVDVSSGKSLYSPTIAYHRESGVIQLLDGFFMTRGKRRKRKQKKEMRRLELAPGWI